MSHTPYATARLAEAARLRALANELAKGVDRRYGAFGHQNSDESAALFAQAREIEASVLIPFATPKAFEARDCAAAFRAAERQRVMATTSPRLRRALIDIEAMGKPGWSWSLGSGKRLSVTSI